MEHLNHFSYGVATPVVSYVVACVGAALGLRCTARALSVHGGRVGWLIIAAMAIGSGIWTMHFIAMLGFSVDGSPVRYDVPLTLISLVVAIVVVGAGVFTVGYGESPGRSILLGGVGTGLGVATMHYTGMAAVQVEGAVSYDLRLVAMSVVIAVAAATAALLIMLWVRTLSGAIGASLVMGVAVSAMHYTAMAAVRVKDDPSPEPLTGASADAFLFPMVLSLGVFLIVALIFVAAFPSEGDDDETPTLIARHRRRAETPVPESS